VSGGYDFEFPHLPPAMCNRCGALVQDRTIHDGWHDEAVTDAKLADVFTTIQKLAHYQGVDDE
jgi:hypothetical protein